MPRRATACNGMAHDNPQYTMRLTRTHSHATCACAHARALHLHTRVHAHSHALAHVHARVCSSTSRSSKSSMRRPTSTRTAECMPVPISIPTSMHMAMHTSMKFSLTDSEQRLRLNRAQYRLQDYSFTFNNWTTTAHCPLLMAHISKQRGRPIFSMVMFLVGGCLHLQDQRTAVQT